VNNKQENINSWKNCKNILCIRLDNIGDIIMTTPSIRAIKESTKNAKLTLLVSERSKDIAKLIPGVDQIITFNAPWVRATQTLNDSQAVFEIVEKLKGEKFDASIIFTVYSQNPLPAAMLCYLCQIPKRLAFCHENPYQLLTNWVPDPEPIKGIKHEVKRQLDLVKNVGFTTLNDTLSLNIPKNVHKVLRLLKQEGVNLQKPWIVINPGASEEVRRYPQEKFKELVNIMVNLEHQILLTGNQYEKDLTDYISSIAKKRVFSLAGKLTIEEMTTLLLLSPLLISNNTGPVHIAAALNTPVVVLYANTNPQHTPWKVKNEVLYFDIACKACKRGICIEKHDSKLKTVEPDEILAAINRIMPKYNFSSTQA